MKNISHFRNERGVALLMCLFALLLLTSIGMAMMFMAKTETSVNYNYRSTIQAYYASKAGLEEARDRLRFGNSATVNGTAETYSIQLPSGIPSSTNSNGIVYILNTPDTSGDPVQPWSSTNPYRDDELCNEPFFNGPSNALGFASPTIGVPCATSAVPPTGSYTNYVSADTGYNSLAAMGYKWIRITTKQNCTSFYGVDGTIGTTCNAGANKGVQVCADPTDLVNGVPREKLLPIGATTCESASPPLRPVYLITALAASKRTGISGAGARRMTQYEVANTSLPQLPAAITLDGANPVVSMPNSNASSFDGNDHASGAGCTATPPKPAIGTTDAASNTNVANGLPKPNNYTGAGSAPSVQTVALPPAFLTVGGLQALVSTIAANADQSFGDNPGGVNLGTDASPKVTYINGDFDMGNSHGAGLLLVTGNLTMSGNPDFNGVILVIGKGHLDISGGGNGTFNGGILVANLFDASGNLLAPATSAPGRPALNWNGGGNATVQYDSCWINNLSRRLPFKVIASREEMY